MSFFGGAPAELRAPPPLHQRASDVVASRSRRALPARPRCARSSATLRTRLGVVSTRGAVCVAAAAGSAEDLYAALGVDTNADAKVLKSAYRKLALKFHPDVNKAPDAADKFRRIKAAYTTLSDPAQRARYDQARRGGGGASWGRAGAGSSRSSSGFDSDSDFSFGSSQGAPAEEFYGLGDFFRDLDAELSNMEKRAASASGSGSARREKSLLEELAELGLSVGEELVEFLESGLASSDESPGRGGSSRASSETSARPSPPPLPRPPPSRPAPASPKAEESVDDMLRKMKKEMGLE